MTTPHCPKCGFDVDVKAFPGGHHCYSCGWDSRSEKPTEEALLKRINLKLHQKIAALTKELAESKKRLPTYLCPGCGNWPVFTTEGKCDMCDYPRDKPQPSSDLIGDINKRLIEVERRLDDPKARYILSPEEGIQYLWHHPPIPRGKGRVD